MAVRRPLARGQKPMNSAISPEQGWMVLKTQAVRQAVCQPLPRGRPEQPPHRKVGILEGISPERCSLRLLSDARARTPSFWKNRSFGLRWFGQDSDQRRMYLERLPPRLSKFENLP